MRRRALVLLAAVLPLIVIAAVVIAGRSGTSRTPAKLPVAAGGASTAGASRNAMQMGAPDIALYPIQRVIYEAAPGLAELGGSAAAYKIASDVTVDQVRKLASALGVTGEVVEPEPGAFSVGTDERRLVVGRQAGGLWYLGTNKAAGAVSSSGVACGPAADCVAPTTTVPQRPANLPSADEARAKALDLLRATGMDVRNATVTVVDLTTAWHVRVDPLMDGTPVEGFGAAVTITEAGVEAANGFLGRPVKVDEYPLIGTRAAIDALNRGEGGTFGGGPEPMPAVMQPPMPVKVAPAVPTTGLDCPAPPCATTGAEQVSPSTAVPLPPVTGQTPVRPLPPEPGPTSTLPPLTVSVTAAARVLSFAPSYDAAAAYLVPTYRLTASESRGVLFVHAIDRSWFAPPPEPSGSSASPPPPGAPAPASPGSAPTEKTSTGPSATTSSAVPNKSS